MITGLVPEILMEISSWYGNLLEHLMETLYQMELPEVPTNCMLKVQLCTPMSFS